MSSGMVWKGTSSYLKEGKEPVLWAVWAGVGSFQAEGAHRGPAGAKELGVAEEREGWGGQDTRVTGRGTG